MATSETFSEMLRCPDSGQTLSPLGEDRLAELNDAIRDGELIDEAGDPIERTLDAGLVREDEAVVYPVRDGVPSLLVGDRIVL